MEEVTVSDGAGKIEIRDGHREIPRLGEDLRIALATGQVRRPLRETLRPLLRLLANGRYELIGPEPLFDDRLLVPASAWPPADDARVGYYRKAVRSGLRPVAVLLHLPGSRPKDFILDGHHKIVAYQAERRAPAVIRIVSRECGPTVPQDAGPRHPSAAR